MRKIVLAGVLLVLALPGWAGQTAIGAFRPSAEEMRQLPPYCAVRFDGKQNSPEWEMWHARLGKNFIDVHHYCAGMNFLFNRYYQAKPSEKSLVLKGAKRNFEYMEKAASPDFPLRADVYLNHGMTMKLMGLTSLAVKDVQQAIEINPRLPKAYLELIDLYKNSGESAKALDVAIAGLKHVPDSKALQRRYLEVGGKKPFPEPLRAPAETAAATQDPAGASAADAQSAQTLSADGPASETQPAGEASPAIGTPDNPYCRFCPPPETTR